jgi:hypothetical protein
MIGIAVQFLTGSEHITGSVKNVHTYGSLGALQPKLISVGFFCFDSSHNFNYRCFPYHNKSFNKSMQ